MEEMLDLVDAEDKIIGQVGLSRANRDPSLYHREVAVLIYDDRGRVLFQKRSRHKASDPGYWIISCAGHVTAGLTPLKAAHKELKEELGFDTPLKFIEKELNRRPTESRFFYRYLGPYSGEPIVFDPQETEAVRFFTQSGLEAWAKAGHLINDVSLRLAQSFWKGEFDRLMV